MLNLLCYILFPSSLRPVQKLKIQTKSSFFIIFFERIISFQNIVHIVNNKTPTKLQKELNYIICKRLSDPPSNLEVFRLDFLWRQSESSVMHLKKDKSK